MLPFNAASCTATSTISLHDALPILFNTYKPLTDPKIRDPILAMARANEIPVKQVFEVDASRQTTRVSANVSGLLGDRKSTRLNSSHVSISYAVFCLKKKSNDGARMP